MKTKIIALLLLPALLAAQEPETPQDNVFLSLTRTPLAFNQLPTNATVITQKDIQRTQATTVADVLQKATPIQIRETGTQGSTATPQLRGFVTKGIAIYIDDRRIPPDATGVVNLSQIPLENVEQIEIARGASSILYGADTQGGVIHIRTKRPKATTPSAMIKHQTGSFGTTHYGGHYGVKASRFDTLITATEDQSDGFQRHSKNRTTAGSAHLGYDFGFFGRTSFDGQYTDSFHENSGGVDGVLFPISSWDGNIERTPKSTTDFQNTSLHTMNLQHVWDPGTGLRLTYRVSGTRQRVKSQSSFPSDTLVRNRVGYWQADLPTGFTMGYEYEQQRLNSTSIGTDKTNNWAVLFQQLLLLDRWTLTPAVRFDKNSAYGDTTNPRLGIVHQSLAWLKWSANAGSSFHPPTFADRLSPASDPSPNLKPEKTWQYDAGMEVKTHSFLTAVTVFRTQTTNRIQLDPNNSFKAFNLNESFSQGVEVDLEQTLAKFLSQGAHYTYLQNKGKGSGTTTADFGPTSGFVPLQFSPRHKINYWVALQTPFKFGITNNLQFVDKQFSGNGETGLKLPSYFLWDIRLSQQILDGEVFFAINNILDKHYATTGTGSNFGTTIFPQPGRTYQVGISVKFWN